MVFYSSVTTIMHGPINIRINLIMIWTDLLFNFPDGKRNFSFCLIYYSVGFASSLSGGEKLPTRLQLVSRLRMIGDMLPLPPPPIFLHVECGVNLTSPLCIKYRSVEYCSKWCIKIPPRHKRPLWILCLWFRASLICINNCPMRCNTKQSIYRVFQKELYNFESV